MAESTPSHDSLTKYVPVDIGRITTQTKAMDVIRITHPPHPSEMPHVMRAAFNAAEKEKQIRQESMEPTPTLEKGLTKAKQTVNNFRREFGLLEVPEENMQVALLDKEQFHRTCESLIDSSYLRSVGLTLHGLDPVLVAYDTEVPEYYTAGIAVHELIHRWLEQYVGVYATVEEAKDKTKQQYKYKFYEETRRVGLRFTNEQGQNGELLNELPNLAVQEAYLTNILDEKPTPFREEIERRAQFLNQYKKDHGLPEDSQVIIPLSFMLGDPPQKYDVLIQESQMHFDANGNPLIFDRDNNLLLLGMQLVSDMTRLCWREDDASISEKLLRAKVTPMFQGRIVRSIEEKMGKGFFAKLNNAKWEAGDVIPLLAEVQEKLYGTWQDEASLNTKNS